MSVMKTVSLKIKDLDAVEAAAARLGLVLRRGQTTFRQHSSHQDESCTHAISVCGKPDAYEIGLTDDGAGGFDLSYDAFNGGKGLMEIISAKGPSGHDAGLFEQAYAVELAKRDARRRGHRVTESTSADGRIVLSISVAG